MPKGQPTEKTSVRRPNWTTNEISKLAERGSLLISSVKTVDKVEFWKETTEHINSVGGNSRSEDEVQRKWTDLKSQTKLKERKRRQFVKGTGGGPSPPQLTKWEELIVEAMPTVAIEGLAEGIDVFEDKTVGSKWKPDLDEDDTEENIPCKRMLKGEDILLSTASTSKEDGWIKQSEKVSMGTKSQCGKKPQVKKEAEGSRSYEKILDLEERKLQLEERKVEQLEKISDSLSKIHSLLKHKIVEDDISLEFF